MTSFAETFFAEALEVVQFDVETTAGTKVPGTKQFSSLMFDIDPKKPTTEVMQAGNLFPVDHVPGKGHSEISMKGEAAVQDLMYIFATMFQVPTFSGHVATYFPNVFGGNTRDTLTFEKGQQGSGNASSCGFVYFNSLDFDLVPDKTVSVTGKGMAQQYAYAQTLTATPTTLGTSVLFPTSIDVYVATTEGGLSGGLITPLSCKIKFDKFLGDVYALNSAKTSFDGNVETRPNIQYELVLPKSAAANAYISAIDTDDLFFIQVIAKGALYNGSNHNQITFTSPIRWMNPGEGAAQDVHTVSVTGNANYSSTFSSTGGAIKIDCESSLTAL